MERQRAIGSEDGIEVRSREMQRAEQDESNPYTDSQAQHEEEQESMLHAATCPLCNSPIVDMLEKQKALECGRG